MKDLLLYAADADAEAFLKAILARPEALGTRPFSFDTDRHPMRDSGMVQTGPALARMKKGRHSKLLMVLDHHGSGRDHIRSPAQLSDDLGNRLDQVSWSGNHAVTVLAPELEQWLWYCMPAVSTHLETPTEMLDRWGAEWAAGRKITLADAQRDYPKELFEHILRDRLRRTISPRDFQRIGERAGITRLCDCPSFQQIVTTLRRWFPA